MKQQNLIISMVLAITVVAASTIGVVYVNKRSLTPVPAPPSQDQTVTRYPTKDTPSKITQTQTGNDIALRGTIDCLPSKNTNGPQNLSCAIGLKGDDGKYYALENLPQEDLISGKVIGGAIVEVNGTFRANPESTYAIAGTISVSSYTVIAKPTPPDDL